MLSPFEICCQFIERQRASFECIALLILPPRSEKWTASVTIDYDSIDAIEIGVGDSAEDAIRDLATKIEARKD